MRTIVMAVCFLLGALLIALWVRSFYVGTVLRCQVTRTKAVCVVSQRGHFGLVVFDPSDAPERYAWGLNTVKLTAFGEPSWDIGVRRRWYAYAQFMVPWWFVALMLAVICFFGLRAKAQFSLRTLVIITTLAAGAMGLAANVVRH